jgi:pterin-4a-carbinolamine dehydratase
MRPTRLVDQEVASRVRALRDWTVKDGKLHQDFRFADFTRAFAFMTAVRSGPRPWGTTRNGSTSTTVSAWT